MGMKVSVDAMSPNEFREHAERMSQYIDLRGCKTEKCIKERIRSKNSAKLNGLIKTGFVRVRLAHNLIKICGSIFFNNTF